MVHDKHFTLGEAERMLQLIKPSVKRMIELKKILDDRGYDIFRHQFFGGIGPNGTGVFPKEMEELVEIVRKITNYGVQVKGVDNGLLDFPHIRRNGEEVYLCWMQGEDHIRFWHTIPGGFAGRKSISEL